MSANKRLFQVAKEFNISTQELIKFLTSEGFEVRNYLSPLTDEEYARVAEKYGSKPAAADKDTEFRRLLREKQAKEQEEAERARRELEERLRVATELVAQKPALGKRGAAEKKQPAAPIVGETPVVEAPAIEPVAEQKPAKPRRPTIRVIEIPPKEQEKAKREVPEHRPEPVEAEEVEAAAPVAVETEVAVEKPKPEGEAKKKEKKKKAKDKKKKGEEALEEELLEIIKPKKEKKKKKKKPRPVFNDEEIEASIRQTFASMEEAGRGKRKRRREEEEEEEQYEEARVIRVSSSMSPAEMAKLMGVEVKEVIRRCMDLGMMVTINQRLDLDAVTLLAEDFGFQVETVAPDEELIEEEEEDDPAQLVPRPPVVTIMGHVDHGKTSLLDRIRESNIIAGEAGGITQHIGAYEVTVDGREITFLDTPGHEAFTAMRARGAQATDIVVLVVAADDSVMPQTVEAISHAKAANVPIIVAINKIDKPNANPDLIRKQLAEHGVLVEEWGGKYQSVEISAKTGLNVDKLLEKILLEADILELKANPNRRARGVIIESHFDKGKGVSATVLVQNGTLRVGDPFIAGDQSGKVRYMTDERDRRVKEAGPSRPVKVFGFDGRPQPGDKLVVLKSERDTKEISQKRQQLKRELERLSTRPRTLDEISRQIQKGQLKQLKVILKTDVDGSLEAIFDSLQKLATEEVAVDTIHKGVGAITESDVLLASASDAIIIGFNVRPTLKARQLAERDKVDIRTYTVIYDIIDEVKAALEGFLSPTISERIVGTLEVRQTFKVPKIGTVAGCYVVSGKIARNNKVRLYRDDRLLHEGSIASLKRFKDDVREVQAGFECGLCIDKFSDIKVGDIIEAYEVVEEKRSL
ncbi:MAG: translation initiation factor IF-2 [candidate division KSB1 bacterium]|nr:translation initiation factor IF-2 [candidate division KSB1 bacterium]